MAAWLSEFWAAFTDAVLAPLHTGTLLYWPFPASAVLITIVLYAWRGELRDFSRQYLTAKVWWHPSARADYRLFFVNATLAPVLFAPFFTVSLVVAKMFRDVLGRVAGPPETPEWLIVAGYSVVVFVAYDFGRYAGHWIQHRFPLLWQFHKVHHSAEVLTPITSFRVHPVDLLIMSVVPALFTGMVTGTAQSVFGPVIGPVTILGMHVGTAAYHATSHLRHSAVWLSYGPYLSRIFVSPAQHQIHHSFEDRHIDRNLGWALSVWDGLFGTLYVPKEKETFVYGLGDGTEADYRGVVKMYAVPFADAWRWWRGKTR